MSNNTISEVKSIKLCNVVPFTSNNYMNKLMLEKCTFYEDDENKQTKVMCFTTCNRIFQFDLII
jgi:hypothetical protein